MSKKILVFGAHPDDAETGCGGTICRYADEGCKVQIVHMTCSKPVRADEAKAAAKIMGATAEVWGFPDGKMTVDAVGVKRVQDKIMQFKPDLVFGHWPVDFHPDHQAVGCLVMRAMNNLEIQGVPEPWPELYMFQAAPGYQTYHFHPNVYVDITAYRQRKRNAAACHASVNILSSYRIIETANKAHGYASGFSYAEAFIRIAFRRGATRDNVVGEGVEWPAATEGKNV